MIRIEAKEGLNHFALFFSGKVQVFLDGVEQTHCTMADDETGEVEAYVLGEDGWPIADGDELQRELRRGRVEIRGDRHPWVAA